jgi:hypothetical protein
VECAVAGWRKIVLRINVNAVLIFTNDQVSNVEGMDSVR